MNTTNFDENATGGSGGSESSYLTIMIIMQALLIIERIISGVGKKIKHSKCGCCEIDTVEAPANTRESNESE